MHKFFFNILLFFFCLFTYPSNAEDFSKVVKEFEKIGIPNKSIGISITQIPTKIYPIETISYGLNQELAFNPASVIKLITTRVAYDLIGKNYRFETNLATNGVINEGVLNGDIFLVGGGDPKLVIEDIEQIVVKLRNSGINAINGNWVVDDSLFDVADVNPSDFDGKPSKPYNVGPNAAMINFKSSKVIIKRSKRSKSIYISLKPELAGVRIKKKLRVVRGGCSRNIISSTYDQDVLRVFGSIGRNCRSFGFYASLMNHEQFGFSVFKKAWIKAGGKFNGSAFKGKTPENAKLLLKWKSPRTLKDLIKDINTMSNNPMARSLFLSLSARSFEQASINRSRKVVNDWLLKKGLTFPEMVIRNGSGLSRLTRISAGNLTSLLAEALQYDNAIDWINTLPKAGLEGTVSQRFANKNIIGNAWLKTGSLNGVQAYGGYIRSAKKNWFAVTILINDKLAKEAREAMDNLIEWVYVYK